jgi:hypothetical protein
MEVAAGLEPAKTGFADQRLGHFGILTPTARIRVAANNFRLDSLREIGAETGLDRGILGFGLFIW